MPIRYCIKLANMSRPIVTTFSQRPKYSDVKVLETGIRQSENLPIPGMVSLGRLVIPLRTEIRVIISRTSDMKVKIVAARETQKAIATIISRMKQAKKSRIRIDAVAIYTNRFGL